jgi:hypothetical protein
MSVFLPFDDYIWRDTFIAHCLRVRLMVFACFINFVSYSRWRQAVVALDFRWMHSFAF